MLNTWQGRRSVGGTSEVWSLCSGVYCCEDFPPYILCPSRFLFPFCKRCTWEESLRETDVKLIVLICCQSLNRDRLNFTLARVTSIINTTQRPLNHTGYTGFKESENLKRKWSYIYPENKTCFSSVLKTTMIQMWYIVLFCTVLYILVL